MLNIRYLLQYNKLVMFNEKLTGIVEKSGDYSKCNLSSCLHWILVYIYDYQAEIAFMMEFCSI